MKLNKISFCYKLSKEIDSNFVSVGNNLILLEEMGLIKKEKRGKCNYISLTEKGKVIRGKLLEIERMLENG